MGDPGDHGELYPSLEQCNEFIDWLLENNDIDLNVVSIRIHEVEKWSAHYVLSVEWKGREKNDPPSANELLVKPGWVIENWFWNGEAWLCGFWRATEN